MILQKGKTIVTWPEDQAIKTGYSELQGERERWQGMQQKGASDLSGSNAQIQPQEGALVGSRVHHHKASTSFSLSRVCL